MSLQIIPRPSHVNATHQESFHKHTCTLRTGCSRAVGRDSESAQCSVRLSCCNLPTSPHALATLATLVTFPIPQQLFPARTKQGAWLNAPALFSSLSLFCGRIFGLHLAVVCFAKSLLNESQACSEFWKSVSRRSSLNFLRVGMKNTLQHLAGNRLCT
jgi:hypothetical protein